MIDKFPYKKILPLNWYEAAIGHLLFFKNLKERMNNNVYFLICEKGILLKAVTPEILKQSEEEVNKFFNTAKIEELDLAHPAQFYEQILEDMKGLTSKLKDNKDCPYINLVYSQKIKQSCLALRKFGYGKPYEIWQQWERDKKGFCFLIVRPDYRWREIANFIYNLIKKREQTVQRPLTQLKPHLVQMSYEKFIWLYLQDEFKELRPVLELKERKTDQKVLMSLPSTYLEVEQLQRRLDCVSHVVMPEPYSSTLTSGDQRVIAASTNELEKITENLYHEFGMPNLVKKMRQINGCLVVGDVDLDNWISKQEEQSKATTRIDGLHRVDSRRVTTVFRFGRRCQLIEYDKARYICRRFDIPLDNNLLICIASRLPCLPRYFFYYQHENNIFLMRQYYSEDLMAHLRQADPLKKISTISTLCSVVLHLHSINITVGRQLKDCTYVESDQVIIECFSGSKHDDLTQLKHYVKQIPSYFKAKSETERAFLFNLQAELNKEQEQFDHRHLCTILERFTSTFH